jgi:hypothetical protein
METVAAAPAAAAAEAKAERDAGTIGIGIAVAIVGIGIRRAIIDRGRRGIIGIVIAAAIAAPVIGRRGAAAIILVHAGIIGVGIIRRDIARRAAGIVRADGGTGQKARAGTDGGTCAGIAGPGADDGAQRRTAQGAADGAAYLFIMGGVV